MLKGTVVRWETRGYGFIRPDGESGNVFFHYSGVVKLEESERVNLEVGQRVEFEVGKNERGPIATSVRRIDA